MKRIKVLGLIMVFVVIATLFCGCDARRRDAYATLGIGNRLQAVQPTPTDIEYSLQRYNLIRRTYWVNGMREKARTLPCPVEKPLGYIYFFLEGVGCISRNTVDGQVTSLNSYLTPDSECYSDYSCNDWLPDVDGTYGENPKGIFFFTVDGNYMEWTGSYLYSDVYYDIEDPVLKTSVVGG